MFRSPFFRRIYVPFVLIIFVISATIGLLGAEQLRQNHLQQAQQRLRSTATLVDYVLGDHIRSADTQAVVAHVKGLALGLSRQGVPCRITIIDAEGKVLADSEADPQTMTSHRVRPEVMMASSTGEGWDVRKSETVHDDLLYYAVRVLGDSKPAYIRLAIHLQQLQASLRSFYVRLTIVTLTSAVLAALAAYFLARRQVQRVVETTTFANNLAQGQLNHRIAYTGSGELHTLVNSLNSMADAIKALLSESHERQAELEAILQNMDEGVLATDASSRVLLANEASARLLGFGLPGSSGKAVWELIRHDQIVKSVGEASQSHQRQRVRTTVGEKQLTVVLCPFEYLAHETRHSGLVIVIHDVTEASRYEDLRKEFVANVSHELRTPLSVLKGYVETLRDGAIDDLAKRDEYLAVIERNTDLLSSLVSDLLEISRLESQPGVPRKARVDVGAMLNRALNWLRPTVEAKGHVIELHVPDPSPVVLGNVEYLERAAMNLIENAAKYTPSGGRIVISVSSDQSNVIIDFADNGIGIPPQDIDRIFERFYRVDRSRSRDMGGTGLGLSIVKHVVQTHGGRIEVTSELNVGSTFRIIFPAAS